ncbi:MAG: tRNA dihydrouridine synthase DusB [Bacteroidota bacterium]
MNIGNIILPSHPLFLAPLEDITDPPFRHLCKKFGADVMYTEFISSEGLIRFAEKSTRKLDFEPGERPIGIQVFGHNAESMRRAVEIAEEAQPDLIDINYGCPVKKVVVKGGGAALLKDIPLMVALTEAVVKATKLPVTVKTRLGWDDSTKNIIEVAERLQDVGIQALTIHGRTRSQLYSGKADWTLIGEVKNNARMKIPIIGNGDVTTPEFCKAMFDKHGVDGVMIGRAAIGNPFIFQEIRWFLEHGETMLPPSLQTRIEACKEHLQRSVAWKGESQAVREMRKHYGHYFKGLANFKAFKMRLVSNNFAEEIYSLLDEIAVLYCAPSL